MPSKGGLEVSKASLPRRTTTSQQCDATVGPDGGRMPQEVFRSARFRRIPRESSGFGSWIQGRRSLVRPGSGPLETVAAVHAVATV